MTEETEIYNRRTDHGKRAALLRLRLAEAMALPLMEVLWAVAPASDAAAIATELSAAIDGIIALMRSDDGQGGT